METVKHIIYLSQILTMRPKEQEKNIEVFPDIDGVGDFFVSGVKNADEALYELRKEYPEERKIR